MKWFGAPVFRILLAMHGAMATESRQDPETDAVRQVRRAVGYDIPIMVTYDLNGNKDASILKEATAVFGYHSSPHVDMGKTGRRAARVMVGTLKYLRVRPMTLGLWNDLSQF